MVLSLRTKVLTILFLVMTVAVLVYPIQLKLFYDPTSALYIFDNLYLFSGLYCTWLILLFILLMLKKAATSQILLLCSFSIVFLGFWISITPFGVTPDSAFQMGHVNYILNEGKIDPLNQNLVYFQYPALSILGASICSVTGMGVFTMSSTYLFFSALLFPFTLFLTYKNIVGNNLLASLGTILLIEGNIGISLSQAFHPINLAFLSFSFLILILLSHPFLGRKTVFLFIILFTALVTGYVSLSFGFLFILSALALFIRWGKPSSVQNRTKSNALFVLTGISFLLFVGWEIYVASPFFSTFTGWGKNFLTTAFSDRFVWLLNMGAANMGERVPLWASYTRIFWWLFIFGFGLFLVVRSVLDFKKHTALIKRLLACLIGVIAFGLTALLISPGGNQFNRLIFYTPFLLIPFILLSLNKRKRSKFLLAAVLLALSLPSFLAYNSRVTYSAFYPSEVIAGDFLSASYGVGDSLTIFSTYWAGSFSYITLYDSRILVEGDPAYYNITNYWQRIDGLLMKFQGSISSDRDKVLIYSEKFDMSSQQLLGISPNDPNWVSFSKEVSTNDRIYSNGNVVLYSPS